MNTSSDYRKSIGDNLGRIIKNKFHKVDDSEVRVCTVTAVYSDILSPETFGTIDVLDDFDGSEYFGVPVNAHINDDGTAGISGKYTFPKIKSAVILKEFGAKGSEQHIPIMFSHIDKLFNQFNEEVTTSVVEVTTADEDNPYDTEETGNKSEILQSAKNIQDTLITGDTKIIQRLGNTLIKKSIEDIDDEDISCTTYQQIYKHDVYIRDGSEDVVSKQEIRTDRQKNEVVDGLNTVTVSHTGSEYKIDTNTAASDHPSVLGDELKTQLDIVTSRIDTLYDAINNAVPASGAADGGAGLQTSMKTILSTQVTEEDFDDILLETLRIK